MICLPLRVFFAKILLKEMFDRALNTPLDRSSRSRMFFKIGVLKNFVIFTGKHLCWSLFLKKLQA